jgi:peptide subunit release factor 1 (eRF1)
MKKEIGLWIDHKEALIAFASGDDAEVKRVESDMEKHGRFSGGAAAATEEDIRDRRFGNHLQKYYDEVIVLIRDADSILILGPGEAKTELKKRLEGQHLGERIVGVEAADKMTEGQVAAKVREHFLHHGK